MTQQYMVPKGFRLYLKQLIQSRLPQMKQVLEKYIQAIKKSYFGNKKNTELQASFDHELSFRNQAIQLFNAEINKMKIVFKRFDKMFGDIIKQYEEKTLLDDKFSIFYNYQWLNNQQFQKMLKQKTDLQLDQDNHFFEQLLSIMSLQDEQYYKTQIKQILNKFSTFENFENENQQQIVRIVLQRKYRYQQIQTIFFDYQVQDNQKACKYIFCNQNLNQQQINDQVQTIQQFHNRVKDILLRYCPSAKKWKSLIIDNQINQLYSQVQNLDIKLIKQSLLKNKFFKSIQQISITMLNQIYKKQIQQKKQNNDDKTLKSNKISEGKQKMSTCSEETSSASIYKQQILKESKEGQFIMERQNVLYIEKKLSQGGIVNQTISRETGFQNRVPAFEHVREIQQNNLRQFIMQQNQNNIHQNGINDEQSQIQKINRQIRSIQDITNKIRCPEIIIRQIHIQIIKQNENQINYRIEELKQMIQKYQLDNSLNQLFSKILNPIIKKNEKISKINEVRKKIQFINLQQIKLTKIQIGLNKQCNNASAFLIIGKTGAGKSTMFVGLAGYKIFFDKNTGEYQPVDPRIRKKYKIGNYTMSVTRWANIQNVNEKWITKKHQKLLLIDTPGLQQNRGIQIDITNNLGTIKLINTLSKGRIIILISQKIFGDRWFSGFKQLIKGISKYLINISALKSTISFILTKGLTKQLLKTQFTKFHLSQGFKSTDWTNNELEFINLMERRFQDIPQSHIIDNPSKQGIYQKLFDSLLNLEQIKQPGQYIDASYSTQTQTALFKAFNYVKDMVQKTLQLGQYELVTYYLQKILTLQSIETNQKQYNNLIQYLKTFFKKKVDKFENLIREYIQYGSNNVLEQSKKIWDDLNHKKAIKLYQSIYQVSQIQINKDKPNNLPQNIIKEIINNYQQQINNLIQQFSIEKLLDKQKQQINLQKNIKKQFIYKLNVIKQFYSQNTHKKIILQISNQSRKMQQKIYQILKKQQINNDQWENIIKIYLNQLEVNIQSVQKQENQRYHKLQQIIKKKYIQNSNQKKDIIELVKQSQLIELNGQLKQKCLRYLKNLQTIQNTHYIIKILIQPEINEIAQIIIKGIGFFINQQQIITKNIDSKSNLNYYLYQTNKQQFYQIFSSLKDKKKFIYSQEKNQQSFFKKIEKNLSINIKNIEKEIQELLEKPTKLKYGQVKDYIDEISIFLILMKQKVQGNNGKQINNKNKKQNSCLQNLLKNSQKILLQIEMRFKKKAQRLKVKNYELNERLIIYYAVFELFQFNKSNQQLLKHKQTQKKVKQNILYPINQIQKIQFSHYTDYQKLFQTLNYLKQLDEKLINLDIKLDDFQQIIPINSSQKIKTILNKSFSTLKQNYKTNFWNIIRLFNEKYQKSINLQSFSDKQLMQKSHSQTSISTSNNQNNQNNELSIKNISQQNNIYYYLNSQYAKKSIDYILSFQQINKIFLKFNQDLPNNIQSQDIQQQSFNLSKQFIQIIQKISNIVEEAKNPEPKVILNRQSLYSNLKTIIFLNKIFSQIKNNENLDIQKIESDLKSMINKQLDNFQDIFKSNQKMYKSLAAGVQFEDLKKMLNHKFAKDQNNRKRIQQLLKNIQYQYRKKIKSIRVQLNKNSDILHNMQQFKTICKSECNIQINYQNNLFSKHCETYFNQLHKNYDEYLQNIRKGFLDYQKQLTEITMQQQKILQNFPQNYNNWKNKNSYLLKNIQDQIYLKSQCIKKNIQTKYMTYNNQTYKVDQKFKQIYSNTSLQNRQKMKNVYLENWKKKYQKMKYQLDQDHQKLQKSIKAQKDQLWLIPEAISQTLNTQFNDIKNKLEQINKTKKTHVQKLLNQKNFENLVVQLQNSLKRKNTYLKKLIIESIENYYETQIKQLDFKNNFSILQRKLESYLKVFMNKIQNKIKQQIPQINLEHHKYIYKIKQELKYNNKNLFVQLNQQMKKVQEINKLSNFNLSNFMTVQFSTIQNFINQLNFLKKFQIFQNQYGDLVAHLNLQIKKQKDKLQKQIISIKDEYLDIFKNRFCEFNINKTVATNFKKSVYTLVISKQKCLQFTKFFETKHFTLTNLSQTINNSISLLQQIQSILLNQKQKLDNWRLQQFLINDTKQRLGKKYLKINNQFQVLKSLLYIINKKEANEQQNIEKNFYQNNMKKFTRFNHQIICIIQQSFINPDMVNGQRVRIFYDMIQILKQYNINLFNKNDLENQVNKIKILLDNKYRQSYQKILNFLDRRQNYDQFYTNLNKISLINIEQSQQIQKLTRNNKLNKKNIQQEKQQKIKQNLKIIENKYKTSEQNKKQKQIKQLRQRIEAESQFKIQGILKQFQNNKQETKNLYSKKTKQEQKKIKTIINEKLIKDLVIFKHAENYYNCEQKISKSSLKLEELLKKIKKTFKNIFIKYLYQCLDQNQSAICKIIMQQSIFKLNNANRFIIHTNGKSLQELLRQKQFYSIGNNPQAIKHFPSYNKHFDKIYNQKLNGFRKTPSKEYYLSRIIKQTKDLANKMKNSLKKEQFQKKDDIVDLVALIFALWTIIEADVNQQEDQISYAYKPHPGQILSIFLILGLDEKISQYKKKIIQIQTGQGKSVILGVLSAYFALIDFDVYQACYSKYLSQRDYEKFQNFFVKLQITRKIKYDIFSQICKSLLNQNQKKTFCQQVQECIEDARNSKSQSIFNKFVNFINFKKSSKKSSKQNKRILLIDESDIFLDQNYLGESYRPSILYFTKSVEIFIYYIWGKRNQVSNITPQSIFKSQQFKNVIKEFRFQEFQNIMKNQVHGILRDLANYQNDVYQLINGKIYYKEGDGLSNKIRYGYRTLFSYLHQYEINKSITISDLNPQLGIHFAIASFSYALLPTYFNSILGVTGTLYSMGRKQIQIIQKNFQISLRKVPSVYPKSRRSVIFKQCTNFSLYKQIAKSIQIQHNKKRPVLVFFKTKQQTYDFFDSQQFSKFKFSGSTYIVTYDIQKQQRDFRINSSTLQSHITLMTLDYSRGTDFIDNQKQESEGVHVISSSLPKSYSDYVQLVGRTGRQGKKGSVLIFITSDAAINLKQIRQTQGQTIIKLNEENEWKTKHLEITRKMKISENEHERSLKIFGQQKIEIKQILKNIFELNQQPFLSSSKSYTAICIDGTGSMSSVFQKVKQVINGAIPNIYKAIKESNVNVQFLIKIVIYRNYNSSHDKLIEYTNYQTNQQNLVNWLKGINVQGGWGNEAIQACFQHINSLKDINQIILIGDAVANLKQEVTNKRLKHKDGQKYWIQNGFPQTHYIDQLKLIKQKEIKINSFYIGKIVKPFFDQLSKQTKGESKQFLINENNATQKFVQFVALKIIDDLKRLVGNAAAQLIQKNYNNIKKNYFG